MTLVKVLESCERLEKLQDAEVKAALRRMDRVGIPSEIDIAGACLGNSVEAVDRLVEAGAIPDSLDSAHREELSRKLGSDELTPRVLRRNREKVADWLGLRGGVSLEERDFPDTVEAGYALFPHQREALSEIRELIGEDRYRVVVHMPTGSGKTRTTMNLVSEWLRHSEGSVVTWLASTTELCEQAVDEFIKAWKYLGDRETPIHQGWGGEAWSPSELDDGLLVTTPQTLTSRKRAKGSQFLSEVGQRTSLIVFDEAHQAIAPTFRDVTEHLSTTGSGTGLTPIVGLTATPGRTFFGEKEDVELVDFFSGNKVTLSTHVVEGPSNPVEFLIHQGYLADPTFQVLLPDRDASNGIEGITADSSSINYEFDQHEELVMDPVDYMSLVAEAVLSLIDEGHRRILVFAASVELSRKISAMLRALGVRAESVDSETPSSLRAGAIARYRSNDNANRVLTNYGVLTTGFDAPQTSAAVIGRPTRSVVLYNQMVGRAIRGPKAGGNREAKIITVVDPNVPAFGSIADAFSHWEDLWNE